MRDDFKTMMARRVLRQGAALVALGALAACQDGTGLTMPSLQMPQWQMPNLQGTLPYDPMNPGSGPGAGAGRGAGGAPGAVTDGFAGQGVAPRIPVDAAPPGTVTPTPVTPGVTAPTTAPVAAIPATPATTHTVVAGETAYSIARKYGITVRDLGAANGLPESMGIRVGQRLNIPAKGAAVATATVTAPGVGSPTPVPPSASQPLPKENPPKASAPVDKPTTDLGSTRTAASSGKMMMPASGSIARAYKKGVNDGIDIAAPAGSAVKAASGGTVAAITKDTDQVPIVVIRHSNGLMTVYANVEGVTVKKGDSVSAGQTIGKARSGPVHFEVRQGFDSVNPTNYL